MRGSGHAVLAVPVPALNDYVRLHTERHDASFLSSDPAFVNAHVTVLGPWLAEPSESDLETVRRIVAAEPVFEVILRETAQFPDGLTYLVPEPAAPFTRLTEALAAAFPQTPPYGGQFPEVVPHLTIDVTPELHELLPVVARVERVDLQWWANHDCHVRGYFPLGNG